MTKILMTFGDSNTHGTPPITRRGAYDRFDPAERWPGVLAATLGDAWDVIEEGLPGRTTAHACPVMGPHMDGQLGLRIALQSHGPIDHLTIMLGTNDLKAHFGLTPDGIAAGIAGLMAIAMSDEYQTRHGGFDVTLICPPPVLEQGVPRQEFLGAAEKSCALWPLYAAIAKAWGCRCIQAETYLAASPVDGIHFEAQDHIAFGTAMAALF